MKDLTFLKNKIVSYLGIYDNERIFENTLQAFARANKFGYAIQLKVKMLLSGEIIAYNDDNLERMLHVDQEVSKTNYDDLAYIAKYQIPTLENILEYIAGSVPLIIDVSSNFKKNIVEKKICEILDNYSGDFAIVSENIKQIKWFIKNKPDYITGYIINEKNYRKPVFFKKFDFLSLDVHLFKDKEIRKIKENKFVLGHVITTKEEYQEMVNLCDALVLDNILEIVN